MRLRFVPHMVTATNLEPALSYLLWDQSTGAPESVVPLGAVGGYTAYSAAAGQVHLNAWDQTAGEPGQLVSPTELPLGGTGQPAHPVSAGYVRVFAQVTPQPDAPTIVPEGRDAFAVRFELDGLTGGTVRIGDLLRGKAIDPDGDLCGLAVLDRANTGGRWQYGDAGGSEWTDLPAVTGGSRVFCLGPERWLPASRAPRTPGATAGDRGAVRVVAGPTPSTGVAGW